MNFKKLILNLLFINLSFVLGIAQIVELGKGVGGGGGGMTSTPEILSIPTQQIELGGTFPKLILEDYLSGISPSNVGWSYRFSHELNNDTTVSWSVSSAGFSGSMLLVAQIEARDTFPIANGHKLGAFHNGELRGVGNALNAGSKWLFYMTIFGNTVLDSLTFKYYHADQKTVFAVGDTLLFVPDELIGHVDNPYQMKAGFVTMDLQGATICPEVIDTEWEGKDTIYVMARGLGSTVFADTAMVIYQIGDEEELPVELISFTGEKEDRSALLNWTIGWSENFLGYEVQRGNRSPTTGRMEWQILGFVTHSNELFEYDFLDDRPDFNENYYKLRLVDIDGSFEWSPTISLDFEPDYQVHFFPNPNIGNTLFFELVTELPALVDVEIYDAVARRVLTIRLGTDGLRQRMPLDISDFSSGLYFAKVKIGSTILTERFVVGER